MRRRNEVLVGLFVTIAMIILIGGTIWLTRGGFRRGYPLFAKFSWGQNLKNGHPVLLAGQNVGYVSDVELRPGYLDVQLRITSDQGIPRGSVAKVIPVGIFGDVAISFTPPLPLPPTNYAAGDTVPVGAPPPDLSTILARVDTIGTSVARLTTALEEEFVRGGGLRDIRRSVASMSRVSEQLYTVIANQDRNLTVLMSDFRQNMNKLSGMLDSAQIDSTIRNVKTLTANGTRLIAAIDSTTNEMRLLVAKANNGRGSLGMLLNDTTMYTNARNLVATLDSLMIDFKRDPKKYLNLKFSVF